MSDADANAMQILADMVLKDLLELDFGFTSYTTNTYLKASVKGMSLLRRPETAQPVLLERRPCQGQAQGDGACTQQVGHITLRLLDLQWGQAEKQPTLCQSIVPCRPAQAASLPSRPSSSVRVRGRNRQGGKLQEQQQQNLGLAGMSSSSSQATRRRARSSWRHRRPSGAGGPTMIAEDCWRQQQRCCNARCSYVLLMQRCSTVVIVNDQCSQVGWTWWLLRFQHLSRA